MENTVEPSPDQIVLFNVDIPEKQTQRNIEWKLNGTVESLKNYLTKIINDLNDPLNFGLFIPPNNGRNGKFLQEERTLGDYTNENPTKLEFKKKARSYSLNTNAPKIKKANSKAFQKQFIQSIRMNDVMKVNKLLNSGLDPNFHVSDAPEIPLTIACRVPDPHVLIMSLVNNGAFMDFRAKDSLTALHKMALEGLSGPMKTLLQLGQSPNCRDAKGLTPLYYCVEADSPAECLETLLYEHSMIGACDEQGLQEIHKACLYGRTVLLDHLLIYGADIDAKTFKGNSALHICALHNQGACARLLLYRGITRYAVNIENKTAYQTALLSNHIELADLIRNYRDADVVPITQPPKFNPKRRSLVLSMKRFSLSMSGLSDTTSVDLDSVSLTGSALGLANTNPNDSSSLNSGSSNNNNHNSNTPSKTQQNTISNSKSVDTFSLQDYNGDRSVTNNNNLTLNYNINGTGSISYAQSRQMNNRNSNTWNNNRFNHEKQRISVNSIVTSQGSGFPRDVFLTKGVNGYGFVIRGIKSDVEMSTSNPSTQYFERIAANSPASKRGLLVGDFLLAVNDVDVHTMLHDDVVEIIKQSGDSLKLKIVTSHSSTSMQIPASNNSSFARKSDPVTLMNGNNGLEPRTHTQPQNISPLLPKDANNDTFIKTKIKGQNKLRNSDDVSLRGFRPKSQAPPPPVRNDGVSSNHENNGEIDRDRLDEPPALRITTSNIIPPPDYTSVEIDIPPPPPPPPQSQTNADVYVKPYKPTTTVIKKHQAPSTPQATKTVFPPSSSYSSPSPDSGKVAPPGPPPPPPPPPGPPPLGTASNSGGAESSPKTPTSAPHAISVSSLQNIVLKPIPTPTDSSNNTASNSPRSSDSPRPNNHDEALKMAVLRHLKKVETGETKVDQIDDIVHGKRVGNKKYVYETGNKSASQTQSNSLSANKPLENTSPNNNSVNSSPSFSTTPTATTNNNRYTFSATTQPAVRPKPKLAAPTNSRLSNSASHQNHDTPTSASKSSPRLPSQSSSLSTRVFSPASMSSASSTSSLKTSDQPKPQQKTEVTPQKQQNQPVNLKAKAEMLRSDYIKRENDGKKGGTMYFSSS